MGKSSSKLKPSKRSQSIAWSFRFPSMVSLGSIGTLSRRRMSSVGVGPGPGPGPAPKTPEPDVVIDADTRIPGRPHLATDHWLTLLDMTKYSYIFKEFNGVEDFLNLTESDLKSLGVRNSSDRARLSSSLVALRAKYHKHRQGSHHNVRSHRHSVAGVGDRRKVSNGEHESEVLVNKKVSQSKSLSNITMDEPAGDPTALRRLLEWELSLDSQDLRSHAWYHGSIPRHRAEEIVARDGDFLVRDCASQPGNLVLSCRHRGAALHFVINKCVQQPDTVYERVQYQFEADAYDTVPDLVTFYVGSGKPISSASGARIQNPRNRLHPLSFYAEKYALQGIVGVTASPITSPLTPSARASPYGCFRSPAHSPPRSRRGDMPPKLPSKQRSLSLTPAVSASAGTPSPSPSLTFHLDDKSTSADGIMGNSTPSGKFSTHSLPRGSSHAKLSMCVQPGSKTATMPRHSQASRELRDDDDLVTDTPPPKPSRVPVMLSTATKDDEDAQGDITPVSETSSLASAAALHRAYQASGSDSGNGSGDSTHSSAAGDAMDGSSAATLTRGVIIKNPRFHSSGVTPAGLPNSCSSSTLCAEDLDDMAFVIEAVDVPELPTIFDLDGFQTLLLPSLENKPLDSTALQGLKVMLLDSGSRILANHLTRSDLDLTVAERMPTGGSWDQDLGLGIGSGIELCSLPIGGQLRADLMERTECLKLLVAVTILTCPSDSERADLLNKWIQVAVDTKTALGNLYGFCGVMLGLCMQQVQRLASTWHVLRQRHTDSAFNFEAKLRPTLKSMNDCSNPQAPNTTIPHLMPFLMLYSGGSVTSRSAPWDSASDLGLGTLFAHLEAARRFGDSLPTLRRNSQIVLSDTKIDDLLLDMFRTEFQLKFLWGSRGASVPASERHAKFDKILTVLSEKCEAPPNPVPAPASSVSTSTAPLPILQQSSIGTSV